MKRSAARTRPSSMCVQDQTHLFCVKHDLPLSLTPPALVSPGAFIKAARHKQIDASKQGKTEPDGGSGERDPYPSLTEEDGEKELLLFLGTTSGVRVKNAPPVALTAGMKSCRGAVLTLSIAVWIISPTSLIKTGSQ